MPIVSIGVLGSALEQQDIKHLAYESSRMTSFAPIWDCRWLTWSIGAFHPQTLRSTAFGTCLLDVRAAVKAVQTRVRNSTLRQ